MPHVVEAKIMDEICDLAGASRVNIGPQCAHCVVDRVGIPLLQSLERKRQAEAVQAFKFQGMRASI